MSRQDRQRQVFTDLLDRYGREVAEAFDEAMQDLRTAAEIQKVIAALEAGNVEAALDAMHLDEAAFDALSAKIEEAYRAGGQGATQTMPGRKPDGTAMMIRFSGRNTAAEQWLRTHSAQMVTYITTEQRELARIALTEAMERGDNPRTAALDLVGRVDRATGRREGGVLGLTPTQAEYVATAREELASGDPAALRNYLSRKLRDRRFDRTVAKAIDKGEPVSAETAAKMITAYERRLLKLRGDTIGRVEAMTALQAAKHEAYRQLIASGQVDEASVRKVWRSAGDLRVRHTHQALNGESVAFNASFVSPSGARMRFPMDTALGAGPAETINCRCDVEYRVDFLRNIG